MKSLFKTYLSPFVPENLLKYGYKLQRSKVIKIDQLGLIYVPIEKVACRSIKTCLAEKLGMTYHDVHQAAWNYISLDQVSHFNNDYHSFGFVRNPLERLLSCYSQKFKLGDPTTLFWKYGKKIKREMTFGEFAEFVISTPDSLSDRHFKSQHHFLYHSGQLVVNHVAKYEHLNSEWMILAKKYDLPDLSHHNPSNKKPIEIAYSRDLALRVSERYAKDIQLFNYESDIQNLLQKLDQ